MLIYQKLLFLSKSSQHYPQAEIDFAQGNISQNFYGADGRI